jgi:hypothetical protein
LLSKSFSPLRAQSPRSLFESDPHDLRVLCVLRGEELLGGVVGLDVIGARRATGCPSKSLSLLRARAVQKPFTAEGAESAEFL